MAHTNPTEKEKKEELFDWDKAHLRDKAYLSQQRDRRNKSQMGSFHKALNAIDSGLMFTQTSGDTISTAKDAVATAAKTTSILGHILLGIGDPIMMLSIGLRAAFGFVRALVDKGIEARKTRLATSFLNLSLATLAVVMVFGVIATAPAFSIPLCLLGATLFGYYSDHQVIAEKKRRLGIAKEAWINLETEKQVHELLTQKDELLNEFNRLRKQKNFKQADEIESMIHTINTEIKDLCLQEHEKEAKIKLDEGVITCMTRSKNARMIGALGIVLIIASIFTFPPLALAGFALFITAGIVNGVIRKQQYQHEAKYHQATHDPLAIQDLEKKYTENHNEPKIKYHESEALIEADLKENQKKHPSPKHTARSISDYHPSNETITQVLSESHTSLFDHTHELDKKDDDEGEGEHLTLKAK